MAAVLYPLFTTCHLFLLGWAISLYQEFYKLGLVVLIIIIAAITYDNLIVSIGRWIGEGKLLLRLSQPRFIEHVLLTPLSVVAAYSLCLQAGLEWASNCFSNFLANSV
jgi:membrane protein DedA with SNARE-associated domain